jgi:hypothetical protein
MVVAGIVPVIEHSRFVDMPIRLMHVWIACV